MDLEFSLMKKLKKNRKNTVIINENNCPKYLYLSQADRHKYAKQRLDTLREAFLEKEEKESFCPVNHESYEPFTTYGIVLINESVWLSNVSDGSNIPMKLDISGLKRYFLFNGQIAAVTGRNIGGTELYTDKIETSPYLDKRKTNKARFSMLVLSEEKLINLKDSRVLEDSINNVCFVAVMGLSCKSTVDILKNYTKKNISTVFLVVPSTEDRNQPCIFPQPTERAVEERIFVLNNPGSTILNGHCVDFENIDVLTAIEKSSLANGIEDIRHEASKAFIFQKSYFPVYETNSTHCVSHDGSLSYEFTPDIFITSGKSSGFSYDFGPCSIVKLSNEDSAVQIEWDEGSALYKVERNENVL
ncbi:DNA polymerase alpha subunit B [Enteropsectra breve]|nr:DNA polymerase alpha subunit B [Enteropsectra breve]